MAELVLTGDVMLGRRVAETLAGTSPEHPWGDLRDRLAGADATFGNLECALTDRGTPADKRFTFRCPTDRGIPVLEAGGVDLVTLANNHVLDFGVPGLEDTLDALDGAGIARAGAGRDEAEAWQPATVDVGGLEAAVVGITDNVRAWAAGPSQAGTAYVPVDPDRDLYDELRGRIRQVRPACDLLVVGAHWGPNMRRHPPDDFQVFARGLLEAGADVVWGHSAHVIQGIERHAGGLVVYDAGDLVDDYRVDPEMRNDLGILVEVDVTGGEVGEVRLTPTRIDPRTCQVNAAEGEAATWVEETMRGLCEGFGTPVADREGPGLVLPDQP